MKREIKYRAWDNINKYMVGAEFGNWLSFDGLPYEEASRKGDTINVEIERSKGLIVLQFTGIKDRNDKDIYEGDIVKFHYFYQTLGENLGVQEAENELTGVIEWGAFGWNVSKIKGKHWGEHTGYKDGEGESNFIELMTMHEGAIHEQSFEVIGNIYQN